MDGSPLSGYILGLSGLIAYYPLNETSGNALNQAPATVGTLNGTVTGATQGSSGKVGLAYSFDGSGDVIALGNSSTLNPTEFSFIFMVYLNTVHNGTAARKELMKRDGPYIIDFNASGSVECAISNGSYQAMSTNKTTWAAQTWFMIGCDNKSGTGRNIYVNGVLDKNTSGVATQTSTNNMFLGAADGSGTTCMNGLMQHVILLNRQLTAAEHLTLAQLAGLA